MKDTSGLREKVFSLFPLFVKAGHDLQAELFEHATLAEIPARQFICLEGNICSGIPLVLEGRARVYKLSESGREITLYRVEPGDSCILTASCIMSGVEFPAFVSTETKVVAIVIPPAVFRRWVNKYDVWSQFLWGLLSSRFAEVISLVEEVAFQRVDKRTADYLLDLADGIFEYCRSKNVKEVTPKRTLRLPRASCQIAVLGSCNAATTIRRSMAPNIN